MTSPAPGWRCRWCRSAAGDVVLDLGRQPAADVFPAADDATPDALHPLAMVLCRSCGLAQLQEDETDADEPRGVEPAALVEQARAAVQDLAAAGFVADGARVAEEASPHGGSWLGLLLDRGTIEAPSGPVDLLVDSLGMMHDADQRAAFTARAARLAPDGVLALHVHPLGTVLRDRTWNVLRHGHFAYYSVTWLVRAAASLGLVPVGLWTYPLYGGTVVLALAPARSGHPHPPAGLEAVLAQEARAGVAEPAGVGVLQAQVARSGSALRAWFDAHRGDVVVGYGAASRAVTLLRVAGATRADLAAVVDASPAKHGRAMPGTADRDRGRVPIVDPAALERLRPSRVLLFVPDLLTEVRRAFPSVEAGGGRWVVAEPEPAEQAPAGAGPAGRADGVPERRAASR